MGPHRTPHNRQTCDEYPRSSSPRERHQRKQAKEARDKTYQLYAPRGALDSQTDSQDYIDELVGSHASINKPPVSVAAAVKIESTDASPPASWSLDECAKDLAIKQEATAYRIGIECLQRALDALHPKNPPVTVSSTLQEEYDKVVLLNQDLRRHILKLQDELFESKHLYQIEVVHSRHLQQSLDAAGIDPGHSTESQLPYGDSPVRGSSLARALGEVDSEGELEDDGEIGKLGGEEQTPAVPLGMALRGEEYVWDLILKQK
ncbi:hypothetical protein SISNIDRAFT_487639 [Sistotremastrum niveocremeum HHB9708]|uniref:Uncharacterized protein n=1 Tax=Sistotremastrum niveocremeum HHB9708 TaxID=1314777 RepID=A0A164SBH3_9AGAM|nr:hypothetical protein SISNIDRAFT_487639 [Sistotremastrum niveocremeum HHB9708]